MALTLPYPDMDFVPLDILTAQEQDQLVANIEYIANQFPIQSANLASGAVKSQNIDWTTFESNFSTENNFDIGLSPTTKCSYTVEKTGKYLVIIDCCINALSTQHTSYLQIRKNGSSMYQRFQTSGANDYANLKVSAIISCNAGDTISASLSDSYGIPADVNTIVGSSVIRVG